MCTFRPLFYLYCYEYCFYYEILLLLVTNNNNVMLIINLLGVDLSRICRGTKRVTGELLPSYKATQGRRLSPM